MTGEGEQAGGQADKKLGPAFWIVWTLGFVLLIGAYVSLLWWNALNRQWSSWISVAATIAFTLLVVMIAITPSMLMRKKGGVSPMRLPMRRYLARFLVAMTTYTIGLTLAMEFHRNYGPTGPLAWGAALLPAIGTILAIRAVLLLMKEEDDEFQKAMHVQAFVLASGGMMAIATLWGFFEMFGLVPHLPMWSVFPLWAVCLGPAQLATRWRFR